MFCLALFSDHTVSCCVDWYAQGVSVTPLECPVGCALFFPSLMTDCEDTLAASGLSEEDMADYQRFSERCLDQDSRALVYVCSLLFCFGCRKDRALNPVTGCYCCSQ